uniref:Uncharacterized protein n=1 Tax=Bionectria ochroleuca TaxID=29856 RepID=A0A8H7NGK8_BIOOC
MDDDIILLLSEGPDKCVSSNTDLDKCGSFDILDGSTVQTPTVTSILRLTVRKSPSMPNCAIFVDCSPCFVSALLSFYPLHLNSAVFMRLPCDSRSLTCLTSRQIFVA